MKRRKNYSTSIGFGFVILCIFPVVLFIFSTRALAQAGSQRKEKPPMTVQEFASPVRLALGSKRCLLVSDYQLKMVMSVDKDTSEILNAFAVPGRPLGIAFAEKRIYVGDESNQCIQVFSEKGGWEARIGGFSSWPIKRPNDIAADSGLQRLFVVDTLDKAVKVFSFDGLMISTIPTAYPDAAALSNPTGIVLDPNAREVFVSDFGNINFEGSARVQVFSYEGAYLRTISSLASGGMMGKKYFFSRPQGLALDGAGHLFVVGSHVGQVLVFDQYTGSYLYSLGSYGSEPGQLRLPLDVEVDERSGVVFVTNNQMKRIEVFR